MALPNNNINPGRPPLLWSEVNEAFKQINENFDSVAATLSGGGGGLSPINFETLDTSVSPTDDNTYALGSNSKRWKYLYASEYSDVPGEEFNGVWLGTAHIQGVGGTVNLPANSTVDGSLLIDPDKTFFKEVQVDDGESIIATDFGSSLKITSGTAISVTVDSGAESLIIDNTGVTSLTGSTYIGVDTATGDVTITNLGVTTVSAGAAVSGRTAGAGISVSGATGNVTITNTGILTVDSGSPGFITVSTDGPSGVATVSFNSGAVATAAFRYVVVDGDNIDFVEADSVADTLNFVSGAGINITKVPGTDTITFNVNTNLDINGSVFADDSTVIVDATESKIYANRIITPEIVATTSFSLSAGGLTTIGTNDNIELNALSGAIYANTTLFNITGPLTVSGTITGDVNGSVYADDSTLIIDGVDGKIYAPNDIVVGMTQISDGLIRSETGNSLILSAGNNLELTGETFVTIISDAEGAGHTWTFAQDGTTTFPGALNVGTIDTTDSSAITVIPAIVFNSDVTVENELFVGTSRVLPLDELKTIVAASADFADFQARIAAL